MMQSLYPGVWRMSFGESEEATPVKLRHYPPADAALRRLAAPEDNPLGAVGAQFQITPRGCVVTLPLQQDEQLYGLGLQLLSFNQRDLKKTLRVNSDPKADLGDSHAPVPFYVSTRGYGVLVDTARYATFYLGCATRTRDRRGDADGRPQSSVIFSTQDLMERRQHDRDAEVVIEVPYARGVDVYLFGGPGMLEAVQRYNLFSGGGCVPARWGLGAWYRCRADFDQQAVLQFADDFMRAGIPCDVLGLEPGWQTHSYSCSFLWSDKFPQPADLARELASRHYRLNLWTHAFIHASSPIYGGLLAHSGDREVWQGLVPDLTRPEARRIMGGLFEQEHIEAGVSGYKLDECDNSDFIVPRWSYPELSRFPSGLDGEQFHSLMGIQFQETVDAIFRRRNQRSFHEVRSSGALAAPYPFVLYSDLYEHRDFIRGLVNCGFSGLLWCPEVRHAGSAEDLIRRLQTAALSPQALINAWYIQNPPWKQWVTESNNAGVLVENWPEVEAACRDILKLRMQFIPYLYSAFHAYRERGVPPFRALVLDYPHDRSTWGLDDEYLMGDRVLVAPVIAGVAQRNVYLPEGDWFDFWTGERRAGGQTFSCAVPLNIIPVFVKAGSLLPLATPTLHAGDRAAFELSMRVYGDGSLPITLVEDDGMTYDFERGALNRLTLSWNPTAQAVRLAREGDADCPRYTIREWWKIG